MRYARGGQPEQQLSQQTLEGNMENPQEMMQAIQEVTSVPGGGEMLMSVLAGQLQGDRKPTKQVRLYNIGGPVGYDEGGLAAADQVAGMGRGDDEMILHLAPEEYEALVGMWGEPEINPNTGMPEYGFLSKLWKGIKKVVKKIVKSPVFSFLAPIALNAFFPGAGAALGKFLGMGVGKVAATAGNALIQGGIGAASGGKEGALSGVIGSLTFGGGKTMGGETLKGVGADIGAKFGLEGAAAEIAGNALVGGVGGEIGGGGFAQGALGNVTNAMMMRPVNEGIGKIMSGMMPGGDQSGIMPQAEGMSPIPEQPGIFGDLPGGAEMTGAMSPVTPPPGGGGLTVFGDPKSPGMFSKAGDWIKDNPALTVAGLGMLGSMGGEQESGGGAPQLPDDFLQDIPLYDFDREQQSMLGNSDYYTYGQTGASHEGEHQFFTDNTIGQPHDDSAQPLPGLGGQGGGPRGGGPNPHGGRGGGGPRQQQQNPALAGLDPIYGVPGGQGPTGQAPTADQLHWMEKDLSSGGGPYGNMFRQMQQELRQKFGYDEMVPWHGAAQGGYVGGYAGGGYAQGAGTGRDDTIEALLSDGEYVMDAETVAMLGDGSNNAGAERLDEMRAELRRHKGKNLSRGKFSANARRPMQYLNKGGRARYKKGGPVEARLERIAIELGEA